MQNRTQVRNRVYKILEDTNIKLASVVSDLFGKSARAMLDALVGGERDPRRLARLAMGTLRKKIPDLELALVGEFTEHDPGNALEQSKFAFEGSNSPLNLHLQRLDLPIERIMKLERQADEERMVSARDIVAEIGTDMSRFGTPKRLSSWAAVCPGNRESAGKRKSGKTRDGSGNSAASRSGNSAASKRKERAG